MEDEALQAVRNYFEAYATTEPNIATRHSILPSQDIVEENGEIKMIRLKKADLQADVVKYATDRVQRKEVSTRVEMLSDLSALVHIEHDCQSEHLTGKTKSVFIVCKDKYNTWKIASSWTQITRS